MDHITGYTKNNTNNLKVLIASGGSGGHIFPALSVASELKKTSRHIEILMITGRKDIERELLRKRGYKSVQISMKPFPRRFDFKILSFMVNFIKSFFEVLSIILRFRPAVVVGFGGYITCPVIIVASILRIPTLIHEQNLKFGLANTLLKNFVRIVAVSFEKTSEKLDHRRVLISGNPVRDDLVKINKEEALDKFNLTKNRFTILVMGGTVGSHSINENFIEALKNLEPVLRAKIQIVHITGLKDADYLRSIYGNLKVPSEVFSYLDNISYAYSASDLVISRAGAASINEIINFGLPSILVPYPHAGAHQMDNAMEYCTKGACLVFEENNDLAERISFNLREFLLNRDKLETISIKARKFNVNNAAKIISDEIVYLGKKG